MVGYFRARYNVGFIYVSTRDYILRKTWTNMLFICCVYVVVCDKANIYKLGVVSYRVQRCLPFICYGITVKMKQQ